jgi:tetratricopeptide (TPR) repeat protein
VLKAQRTGEPHTRRDYDLTLGQLQYLPASRPGELEHPVLGKLVVLEIPYPPCVRSLGALEPVLLSELTMRTHHRGRVLNAKLVGVGGMTQRDAYAAIEDTSGDIEYLHVQFVCMNKKDGYPWPKLGTCLSIKEPYLTLDEMSSDPCIQIDHPSDLVFSESRSLDLPVGGGRANALECKEAGNFAFAGKNLEAAHASYTEGIRLATGDSGASDQSVKRDLHRNRSLVRHHLGHYEGALEDAVAALTYISDAKHKKLDAKAYLRAASASYSLKLYGKAALLLSDQLMLVPGDKEALDLLERIQSRLREQNHGAYDIESIRKSISDKPRVDAADFSFNTIV